MSAPKGSPKTLYNWAFRLGKTLLECLTERYGDEERAKKSLKTFILNLRSEALPERFKRTLLDFIIEAVPECMRSISIHSIVKGEKPWRIDEFYRYSTIILSGLYDSIFSSAKSEGGNINE